MKLEDKKVLVFGSGKSGVGAADALIKVGAEPIIYEGNTKITAADVIDRIKGDYNPDIYVGEIPEEVIDSLDLVVMSPGVPLDIPLVLLFAGFIYIVETLSVILQVSYFKATHGKRLFKMAPIHHHFEMCGWKEERIVLTFAGVSALMCVVAWLSISGLVH